MNEKKENTSPKVAAQKERFITSEEKAQYEVFRNGNLPRETIEHWIENDLKAIKSFVHGILSDANIKKALVDAYYDRYKKLHENSSDNVERVAN